MSARSDENTTTIRRLNDEVMNGGRLELIPELYAAELVSRRRGMPSLAALAPGPPRDHIAPTERLALRIAAIRTAFPDWRSEVFAIVADGDTVVARYELSGTHRGPLFGIEPTGRAVHLDEVVFYRLQHRRIVEDWAMADELGLLLQLDATHIVTSGLRGS
ncbi:MAG TPA: ester cyclase [Candidatus Limnocylindria bacterium]|nr:ester cyclase [Candidatus Limnocylindria bacterium]